MDNPFPEDALQDPSGSGRHNWVTIILHWLTPLVLLGAVSAILSQDVLDIPGASKILTSAHFALGSSALVLVALRLATRLLSRAPKHPDLSQLSRLAASAAHMALYVLLGVVPILGWLTVNANGRTATLLWLVDLPRLIATDRDLGDWLGDIHADLAWTLVALIGLHAAAALWHHVVRRDAILHAMLPIVRPRRSTDRPIPDAAIAHPRPADPTNALKPAHGR